MTISFRLRLLVLLVIAAATSISTIVVAGGPTVLGSDAPAAQRVPVERLNHSAWTTLLGKYVDERGMVDYAGWKASPSDERALDDYLSHLSTASFSEQTNANVKLAYWINAYNAVTIKGILREYPTSSIRNHTARVFGYNIWKDLKLRVEGRLYSLDQIEHEVLRKMSEPRIHFAIVCASIGCPRLLDQAYVPDRLDEQLMSNARAFFADRTKFHYNTQHRTIAVSPILDWFGEDFGKTEAEQMRRIAPYLPDAAAQQLAESGNARVSYLDYDWGLNDQPHAAPSQRR